MQKVHSTILPALQSVDKYHEEAAAVSVRNISIVQTKKDLKIAKSFADLPVEPNMKFPLKNSFAEQPAKSISPVKNVEEPVANNRYKQVSNLQKGTNSRTSSAKKDINPANNTTVALKLQPKPAVSQKVLVKAAPAV